MNKHSQNFQNRKFGMSYNIYLVKEVREMKLIFCMQINILKVSKSLFQRLDHPSFFNGDTIIIDMLDQASQITQNNKFAISLQYLENEVMDGAHFLQVDKHSSFCKLELLFLMEEQKTLYSKGHL